jgi:alpha(1,3/1,4) fucosyltransferase
MIKIFKIDHLPYTPFDENFAKWDVDYLKSKGIYITKKQAEAQIFLAGNDKSLRRFILRNPFVKNYLIWSQEPRFSKAQDKVFYPFLFYPKVHVMNVYTGDTFISNVTSQRNRFSNMEELPYLENNFNLSNRKVGALMSYFNGGRNSKLQVEGTNIDLIKKRTEIANYLLTK